MSRRLTASERAEREQKRMMENLRNELRKTLERDAQKLLETLRQQLANDLNTIFTRNARQSGASSGNDSFSSVGSLSRIVGSVLRLSAKPRVSTNSAETARSQDAANQFRLSRGQMMADLGSELGSGDRNA